MRKSWIVAAGVVVALGVLGLLTLRFGPSIAARFLDSPSRSPVAAEASAALQSSDSSGALPAIDTALVTQYGPLLIDQRRYVIRVQRDTGAGKDPTAARRVRVFDAAARAVYDENVFLRRDSTATGEWIEFHPSVIEDDAGVSRALDFTYVWYPSAPGSGVAFHVAAPRGDSLAVLTPTVIGFYGKVAPLPAGNTPRSVRLLPGNRLVIESGRGWFDALIPLRIDFGCTPRSPDCVRVDLADSIAGLARFEVRATSRQSIDSAVSLQLFSAPRQGVGESFAVTPGADVEILGGAGRVFFERTPSAYLSGDDEWLEVRVNQRRGWIRGEESFRAIGLQQGSTT